MSADQTTPAEGASEGGEQQLAPYARWAAAAVLLPAVPLLLLSTAALALFYVAPTRFGQFLSRLPGDEYLRTLLVFAPATLLAIVTLALLYALDRPAGGAKVLEAAGAAPGLASYASQASRWVLLLAAPLLAGAFGVWTLSFAAPARFGRLLDRLPGETYLRLAIRAAPLVLFLLVTLALLLALIGRREGARARDGYRVVVRAAVAAVLVPVLPMLLLSMAALAAFRLAPGRFEGLMGRLTEESFLRLGLLFAPAALATVLLLALLYLWGTSRNRAHADTAAESAPGLRDTLVVWTIAGGLLVSSLVSLGVLGVALLLVLR